VPAVVVFDWLPADSHVGVAADDFQVDDGY